MGFVGYRFPDGVPPHVYAAVAEWEEAKRRVAAAEKRVIALTQEHGDRDDEEAGDP